MAEIQPPVESQVNGGGGGGPPTTLLGETVAGPTKRQRRPSVRLGEIGDQHTYDNHKRTKQQQWRHSSKDSKFSKTRHLQTLDLQNKSNFNIGNSHNHTNSLDCVAIGSWKIRDSEKSKRAFSISTKRVKSNWGNVDEDDYDDADRNTDIDREGSGSQLKDQSDGNCGIRVRVSDGVELDGPSDTDARNWNNSNPDRNGVRVWLNQLGLGRYFPIFEVHEVDDEVLPLLTLEDLKDMGIIAVGSRRKMFCSIQKLGKGFS